MTTNTKQQQRIPLEEIIRESFLNDDVKTNLIELIPYMSDDHTEAVQKTISDGNAKKELISKKYAQKRKELDEEYSVILERMYMDFAKNVRKEGEKNDRKAEEKDLHELELLLES